MFLFTVLVLFHEIVKDNQLWYINMPIFLAVRLVHFFLLGNAFFFHCGGMLLLSGGFVIVAQLVMS